MKKSLMRTLSALFLTAAVFTVQINAADTENHPGLRLQTILVNNGSSATAPWTTEGWGGQNLVPNSNWTTLTIRDYYENGTLNFEVRNTGTGDKNFVIGLMSKRHGTDATINWTAATAGRALTATPTWTAFSLSIKAVVDAHPTSAFSLDDLWYVAVRGVSPATPHLEFRNVTFSSTDDERQYPMIKVNQAGYELNSTKTARVSYFSKFGTLNGKTFQVINAVNGAAAFSGTLPNSNTDDAVSGERMHTFSFDVTVPGEYFIRIPDAGLNAAERSPRDIYEGLNVNTIESVPFKIWNKVYGDLLTDLIRYFYFQRQGLALEQKYAGDFARNDLHPNDAAVRKWSDRNNGAAATYNVMGGWYDAGDYGKYISPAASTVSDLLLAYELFPDIFSDLELNIPETDPSNSRYVNAPGILSEIKWELDMILKFEHSSKDGSFFIAANYTSVDGVETIYMEDTRTRGTTHTSSAADRDLRSHHATAGAAAVLAHAYLVYKDIPAYTAFANECLTTAIRAWGWVTNPANPRNMSISAANRTYTFNQEDLDREMFWAAGALYRAVKSSGGNPAVYDTYIQGNYTNANVVNCFNAGQSVNYNHGAKSFLGFVHYLYGNSDANAAVRSRFNSTSDGFPSWRTNTLGRNTWGASYPSWGYWWGSNQMIAQNSLTLLLGSMIAEGESGISANIISNMENTLHHLLGINPISFSYVSGHGGNSVMNIYSAIFSEDKKLTPYKIPPGYFTEGTNYYDNRHLSKFDGKCYLDSDGEYTTNENTLYGNAAMVFLTAAVMAKLPTLSSGGGCNPAMSHLVVPSTIKRIASDDFKACNITEVTFMGDLPTFAADALPFNNITKVNFTKENLTLPAESLAPFTSVDTLVFEKGGLTIANNASGSNLFGGSAFAPTLSLTTLILKSGAIIGERAFANSTNLKEAYIPPGVTTIASNAFEGVGTEASPLYVYGETGSAAHQHALANHPRMVFVHHVVSVLSPDRVIPDSPDKKEEFIPITVLSGEFTAGPNPVSKQSGEIKFFWQGKQIKNGTLTVFDASGNVVNRVAISDSKGAINLAPTAPTTDRRQVGSWDLTDRRGRSVSEGTYLIKGIITTPDRKKERVSVMVGVHK